MMKSNLPQCRLARAQAVALRSSMGGETWCCSSNNSSGIASTKVIGCPHGTPQNTPVAQCGTTRQVGAQPKRI